MGLDQGGGRVDREEECGAGLILRMCRLVFEQDMDRDGPGWGWSQLDLNSFGTSGTPNSCPGGPKRPDLADGIQGQCWVTALMTPFLVTEVGHLAHRRQQSYMNVRVGP